jgi:hypothetical protein
LGALVRRLGVDLVWTNTTYLEFTPDHAQAQAADGHRGGARLRPVPAPLRYVGVRPIDSSPVDGPPSSPTRGEIVEGGRSVRPYGPGAH